MLLEETLAWKTFRGVLKNKTEFAFKFAEDPSSHLVDFVRIEGWLNIKVTQWF